MNAVRTWISVGVTAALLVCAGCAAEPGGTAPVSTVDEPVDSPVADYQCNGEPIDAASYAADVRADALPESTATRLASAVDDLGASAAPDDLSAWIVVEQGETGVTLVRPHAAADALGGDHDLLKVGVLAGLEGEDADVWRLVRSASCSLALDPAPLALVTVNLDPDHLPTSDTTELALLVTELACNGGQDAQGRVELLSLEQNADAVIVHVAVQPRDVVATCPSNEPTPFTVVLDSPLGEREIKDGALLVPRPVDVLTPFD